jgi:DNA-binding transcriptional regulator YbjK
MRGCRVASWGSGLGRVGAVGGAVRGVVRDGLRAARRSDAGVAPRANVPNSVPTLYLGGLF